MVDSRRFKSIRPEIIQRTTFPLLHLSGTNGNAQALQQEIEETLGVESAYVSIFTEMVYVIFDPQEISLEELRQHIVYLDRSES